MQNTRLAQIQIMLRLQDQINAQVADDWRTCANPWYRAMWCECAELLDHHGWKWWKKQQPDLDQVVLELVDIWHFGLSDWLERDLAPAALEAAIERGLNDGASGDFLAQVEAQARSALTTEAFDAVIFGRLMADIGLEFETLFRRYVGKNVLNRFRQDHGYNTGDYIKVWYGREDNEHLIEAMAGLDADTADFQEALYRALQARYESLER